MPTGLYRRLLTAWGAVTIAGAVWSATREFLRDRQNSKYVRDQLAARSIETGV